MKAITSRRVPDFTTIAVARIDNTLRKARSNDVCVFTKMSIERARDWSLHEDTPTAFSDACEKHVHSDAEPTLCAAAHGASC